MMKTLLLLSFTFLTSLVSAQQNVVIVEGRIKGLPANAMIYWQPYYSDNLNHWDSVKVTDERFTTKIRLTSAGPDAYVLRLENGNSASDLRVIYLEKDTIRLTGEGPLFQNLKVEGGAGTMEYENYRFSVLESPRIQEQKKVFADLSRETDSIRIINLQSQYLLFDSLKSVLAEEWVKKNPQSPISAFVISSIIKTDENPDLVDSLYSMLKASALENQYGRKLKQSVLKERETGKGKSALQFSLPDVNGKMVKLESYRGKYILIDIWASWCVPCRAENGNLIKAYNKYESKNFTIISISIDASKEKWLKAVKEDNLPWTNLFDPFSEKDMVAKHKTLSYYNFVAIPSNVLLSPDGFILGKNFRGQRLHQKLAEVLGE